LINYLGMGQWTQILVWEEEEEEADDDLMHQ
jgi:hypothetical protein